MLGLTTVQLWRLELAIANMWAKFEISFFSHYEDRKGVQKVRYCVLWRGYGHSRSSAVSSNSTLSVPISNSVILCAT